MKIIIENLISANSSLKKAMQNCDSLIDSSAALKSDCPSFKRGSYIGYVSNITSTLTDIYKILNDVYKHTYTVETSYYSFENNILGMVRSVMHGDYGTDEATLKEKLGSYYDIVMSNVNANKAAGNNYNNAQIINHVQNVSYQNGTMSLASDTILETYYIDANGNVIISDEAMAKLCEMYDKTPDEIRVIVYTLAYEAAYGSREEGMGVASVLLNRCNSTKWTEYENSSDLYTQITFSGQFNAYFEGGYNTKDAHTDPERISGVLDVLLSGTPVNNYLSFHSENGVTYYTEVQPESDKINDSIVVGTTQTTTATQTTTTPIQTGSNNSSSSSYSTYTVVSGDTLGAIAKRYGMTVEEICEINGITNPDRISIGQKISLTPSSNTSTSTTTTTVTQPETIATPSTGSSSNYETYTVVSGDTLSDIARRYGMTVDEICEINGITNPDQISIGQKISFTPSSNANTNATTTVTTTQTTTTQTPSQITNNTSSGNTTTYLNNNNNNTYNYNTNAHINPETGTQSSNTINYTVHSGDTLTSIAERNNTTVDELKKLNNFTDEQADNINTGQSIITNNSYDVQSGDSLSSIAQRYNTTVEDLMEINPQITNADEISVGQDIKLR